jgi:CBS domain containing-hemolysin-like protein
VTLEDVIEHMLGVDIKDERDWERESAKELDVGQDVAVDR